METDPTGVALNLDNEITRTPSRPEDLRTVELSDNAKTVLVKRYLRRGEDGQPSETMEEMFWRVAYNVALVEEEWDVEVESVARDFYELISSKRFFPNSPTFTGAGTPLGQLAACFVLPIADDMGRDSQGIFQTLRNAALIQQTGGGNGFSFSRLRPNGDLVNSSRGEATGPVGFLRVYDRAFGVIAQGGTRRGANMAVLRVDHPDIESFISCKTDENAITNFNISIGVTDEFMEAVKNDDWWELRFPDITSPEYSESNRTHRQLLEADAEFIVYERVRARELFNKIVQQAHHNGEPGVLFLDSANRSNPVPHLYDLEATNPCGEQWLGPYENCCLGSINLAQHFGPNRSVDWSKLRESVQLATRFLDDVVSANAYVPAVPQLEEAALRARRIGLGIMGLGDLLYHTGIRYGSEEAQEFSGQVMEFIRFHSMLTSVELARERGPFSVIEGSIYDPDRITWEPPKPLHPFSRDFGRPVVDWQDVLEGIRQTGIRNAAQTTVAPTGTIATVAGCEGYGCEPVFALAYFRHVDDDGDDLRLTYTSPMFDQALIEDGIDDLTREMIIEAVMKHGSCQEIDAVPEDARDVFVVSHDISADEHVRMQAAMQVFVDNSMSKTCNFPADATVEDVAQAYILSWELGCKGLTVYVTGSRQKVVLETKGTADAKALKEGAPRQIHLWLEGKKPREQRLDGCTYQITTPLGKAFVTINENGGGAGQPFEIFITTAKAGSETAAVSEAIGRLISYLLRIASPVPPRDRLGEVVRQLAGIGGGRPTGFGPNRVLSLPDGLARALAAYLEETPEIIPGNLIQETSPENQLTMRIGDLCPECGAAALVNEEGCRKCYACGFSEC
ncbi:MAG: adenosylcobalamin-dependent ribonucleoside-diphosphate reductase [Chloroflexota bacterium]|nr:adenosylcobalamin-dependent ribonucleoside-diphosphate reductase [Chloroflexota bacterium]